MRLENPFRAFYSETFFLTFFFALLASLILGSELLQPGSTLKQPSVNSGSDSQGTTDNRAESGQESEESLGPLLAVDDLHRGNILHTSFSYAYNMQIMVDGTYI